MSWWKERVWQMGLAALLILAGAVLVYPAAAQAPVNQGLLWLGLILIFVGLAIPLLARLVEHDQEETGEEGEC
jgi:hypothetical protein